MKRTATWTTKVVGLLVLLAWLGLSLTGCCGTALEEDYGRSVANNLTALVVNPEAGQKVEVGVGQTPDASANAYDKYNKSFKPEEKKTFLKLTTEQ
jgi:hypothetical protein